MTLQCIKLLMFRHTDCAAGVWRRAVKKNTRNICKTVFPQGQHNNQIIMFGENHHSDHAKYQEALAAQAIQIEIKVNGSPITGLFDSCVVSWGQELF